MQARSPCAPFQRVSRPAVEKARGAGFCCQARSRDGGGAIRSTVSLARAAQCPKCSTVSFVQHSVPSACSTVSFVQHSVLRMPPPRRELAWQQKHAPERAFPTAGGAAAFLSLAPRRSERAAATVSRLPTASTAPLLAAGCCAECVAILQPQHKLADTYRNAVCFFLRPRFVCCQINTCRRRCTFAKASAAETTSTPMRSQPRGSRRRRSCRMPASFCAWLASPSMGRRQHLHHHLRRRQQQQRHSSSSSSSRRSCSRLHSRTRPNLHRRLRSSSSSS